MGPSGKVLEVVRERAVFPLCSMSTGTLLHCCLSLRTEIKGDFRDNSVFGPAFQAVSHSRALQDLMLMQ